MNGGVGVRKRLVVHIGMHKTGSSAIQHFLSRNRLLLRASGVLYPESIGPDGERQPKHNALFAAISHEADFGAPHPMLGSSRDLVARMTERIRASGARMAILSAEGFSGEKPAFARALAPLAGEFDVRIVVFLRRPDEWLASFHRQMIMSRSVRETRSLTAFAEAPSTRTHLDYPLMLTWWAEAFGGDALRIARYDQGELNVVRRFLSLAQAPRVLSFAPGARVRRNLSPPLSAVRSQLAENRGGDIGTAPGDLVMDAHAKRALLSRLREDWSVSSKALSKHLDVEQFIPFMLEQIGAEISDI